MTASINEFFDDLGNRGHEPRLKRVSATVRFDITDGERTEHRLIRIDRGDIRVSVGDEPADCVISAGRAVCDDVVSGRTSALAALLRGAAAVDGDIEVMVLTQRLFTGSQTDSSGRGAATAGRRTS
jgi:putative sterol carrier protein